MIRPDLTIFRVRPLAAALVMVGALAACLAGTGRLNAALHAQSLSRIPGTAAPAALHAKAHRRLTVRNVMVIYGSVKPPFGPVDVVIENGFITYIGANGGRVPPGAADAVIDGTGKYVMPGIVNTHMHWHEDRQPGYPQPIQYERDLYLAAGVTTVREVGGDFDLSKQWQAESEAHRIVSPRIFVYPVMPKGQTGKPDEIRAWIRDVAARGADGLKIIAMDRDQLTAIMDEAHALKLRTAAHIGTEETTAQDYIDRGVTSIEHFYGIADAALDGVQRFPSSMNYSNEIMRFARAG